MKKTLKLLTIAATVAFSASPAQANLQWSLFNLSGQLETFTVRDHAHIQELTTACVRQRLRGVQRNQCVINAARAASALAVTFETDGGPIQIVPGIIANGPVTFETPGGPIPTTTGIVAVAPTTVTVNTDGGPINAAPGIITNPLTLDGSAASRSAAALRARIADRFRNGCNRFPNSRVCRR